LDLSPWLGIPLHQISLDAGSLGHLRMQMVTIDCLHRTYEVVDVRKMLPDFIWRPAASLPALAPVFKDACDLQGRTAHHAQPERTEAPDAAQDTVITEAERAHQAEAERVAAAQRKELDRAEIQRQAAIRDDRLVAEYQEARNQSGFGARLRATGFMQIPVGGSDGVCSRLLVAKGWSKPFADVACHEQTIKECAASLTTDNITPSDMPLLSTAVVTSAAEACANVRAITNPPRAPKS
jgi:hypothetical protein